MNYWLFLVPVLTAFTGWLIVKLIFWNLFHPVQPKKIFGFKWQGVLPSQQENLAQQAGQLAAHSFSLEGIEKKINDPKNFDNVRPLIETHMDDFLRYKLKEQMPMIAMFIGDKTITSLKTVFIQEIENLFPQVMTKFSGNLKNEFNLQEIVSSRINTLSPARVEELLKQKMGKRIQTIALLAGLIGLLVGLLELMIVLMTN